MTVAERRFRLLDGAKQDVRQAARWYEQQATGAGETLILSINDAIAKVVAAPHRWPRIDAHYQRYVLGRYPYSVIYRLHDDAVFIVAVAHHRRHPDLWRDRDRPPKR